MAYSESQKRASIKYMNANTDDIRLRVPKGTKESWRTYANKQGMSMTHFIIQLVNEQIRNNVTLRKD